MKIKLQKAQNEYVHFCLNLLPRSRIDPLHFRKRKLRPATDSLEHCIVNTVLITRMDLYRDIHEMLKPSFLKHSVKSLMSLDIPLWKTNTGQKMVILLWEKYGQK